MSPSKPSGKKFSSGKSKSKSNTKPTAKKSRTDSSDGISTGLIIGITCFCLLIGGVVIFMNSGNSSANVATNTPTTDTAPVTPQKYALKYQFPPGEKVSYQSEYQFSTKKNGEAEPSATFKLNFTSDWVSREPAKEKTIDVECKVKQFMMANKNKNGELIYDSNNTDASTFPNSKEKMDPYINKSLVCSINEIGLVSGANFIESGENIPPMFLPDSLQLEFQKSFVFLPDHEVAVGESWTNKFQLKSFMELAETMELPVKYTLKEVQQDYILIDAESSASAEKVTMKLNCNYKLNRKTMLPLHFELTSNIIATPNPDFKLDITIKFINRQL